MIAVTPSAQSVVARYRRLSQRISVGRTHPGGSVHRPRELLPRVHLVISPLKRWLMGIYQSAVSHKHLDYYLDEFTFGFNRRKSASRGKLFYRLAQHAAAGGPSNTSGLRESSTYPVK